MLKKFVKALHKEQDGSVIVIVALFMTVLIGIAALVLDLGLAHNKKTELQKDMDSVALAAVRELPADNISKNEWKNAKIEAIRYAEYNGISDLEDSDLTPVYENNDPTKRIIGIEVNDNIEVKYNFAKVLGFNSGIVNCDATALLEPAEGVGGLLPLALPQSVVDFLKGKNTTSDGTIIPSSTTLKLGSNKEVIDADDFRKILEEEFAKFYDIAKDGDVDKTTKDLDDPLEVIKTGGWRGAINFSSVGSKGNYKTALQDGGCKEIVYKGDEVEIKPGTITADLLTNKGELIIETGVAYPVPIIDYDPIDERIEVVGFATIVITQLLDGSGTNNPDGVKILVCNITDDEYVATGVGGKIKTNYYGVMAARLVD